VKLNKLRINKTGSNFGQNCTMWNILISDTAHILHAILSLSKEDKKCEKMYWDTIWRFETSTITPLTHSLPILSWFICALLMLLAIASLHSTGRSSSVLI